MNYILITNKRSLPYYAGSLHKVEMTKIFNNKKRDPYSKSTSYWARICEDEFYRIKRNILFILSQFYIKTRFL
jgi:hexokinase